MGADVADFEPGGGRSKGVGSLLQGGSPDGVAVRVVDDPQDGAVPDYLSAQDSAMSHQEAEEETGGWYLKLFSYGSGNGVSGI